VLLGETGRERAAFLAALCRPADVGAADLVRRALVETISRGSRRRLVGELDQSLLGVRPKLAGRVTHAIAS